MWIMKAFGNTIRSYSFGTRKCDRLGALDTRTERKLFFFWKPYLSINLHDMGYFVPAKANESLVVLRTVSSHDDVRLKVCLPFHLVWRCGCPPFGVIGWRMTLCPDMIPTFQESNTCMNYYVWSFKNRSMMWCSLFSPINSFRNIVNIIFIHHHHHHHL